MDAQFIEKQKTFTKNYTIPKKSFDQTRDEIHREDAARDIAPIPDNEPPVSVQTEV